MKSLGFLWLLFLPEGNSQPASGMRSFEFPVRHQVPNRASGEAISLQDPAKPAPMIEALRYLARHQMSNGAWGEAPATCTCSPDAPSSKAVQPTSGNIQTTGLVLLAFLGAGFSPPSKDTYDARCWGTVVREGIEWLLRRQTTAGAFDERDPATNAIAAFALSEVHGMAMLWPEATQRAVAYVENHPGSDARSLMWQAMVIKSADDDNRRSQKEKLEAFSKAAAAQTGEMAPLGALLLRAWAKLPVSEDEFKKQMAATNEKMAASDLQLATLVLHAASRPGDPIWRTWYTDIRDKIIPLQCADENSCRSGSWDGDLLKDRLETTARRAMTLEHWHCYICLGAQR